MKKFIVKGSFKVDFYGTVEAETLDEALHTVRTESYLETSYRANYETPDISFDAFEA